MGLSIYPHTLVGPTATRPPSCGTPQQPTIYLDPKFFFSPNNHPTPIIEAKFYSVSKTSPKHLNKTSVQFVGRFAKFY